jgi:LmbE family N-acetylglucosaminyl deacetylase
MLLARQAGAKLDVMFVTDGRSKGATPFGETPEETVRVRYREAEQVCRQLDAGLHYLGINNAIPAPEIKDLDRLGRLISELKPQVLLVPWVLDTPKHRIVNHLLWLSDYLKPLPECEVWGYQVHNVPLPNGYVDITEVFQRRQELIASYVSQMAHVKRYDHIAMGMAAWNCRFLPDYKGDPRQRYVEIFCALPLREHLEMIEHFYFPDIKATYRGIDMAAAMQRFHSRVVG